MKLRMRGNSVRLRLTRSEVAQFSETGIVEELVAFPSGNLRYSLMRSNAPELQSDFRNSVLTVTVPDSVARQWAGSEQVGIEARSGELDILIEKDFQCAHGPAELDAFEPERLS